MTAAAGRLALDGRLRDRALATAGAIGERLLVETSAAPYRDPNFERFYSKRLNGTAGYALAFLALATVTGDARYERAMHEQLKRAAEAPGVEAGLFDGVSGLRAVAALATAIEPRYGAFVERCDRYVESQLPGGFTPPDTNAAYDVVSGWSGMRLARCVAGAQPADRATSLLLEFVASEPNWNGPLGVAHGVAGALATLALTVPDADSQTRERALRAARRVAVLVREQEGAPAWPRAVKDPVGEDCRAVWCVGAAGIGSALLTVANWAADEELARFSLRVLESIGELSRGAMRLGGHGLCHGTIGNALIFFSTARQTGSATLADACRRLAVEAIDGVEADGVRCWSIGNDARRYDALGELYGLAGIALALLTMTGDFDTRWLLCHALSP